jgi:hypothetical protein
MSVLAGREAKNFTTKSKDTKVGRGGVELEPNGTVKFNANGSG